MFSSCQDVRRHSDRLFCFLFVGSACDEFYYSRVLERYLHSHPPTKPAPYIGSEHLMETHRTFAFLSFFPIFENFQKIHSTLR